MTINPAPGQNHFLNVLHHTIEEHLSDSEFNVNRLVHLVGMSRTDLHRKLTRKTGMSVSAYVRYVRVQRAKELLLQHPDWCICRVGYEVGFNSPSYFTRVFKAVEGTCPDAFRVEKLGGVKNLEHV